MVLWFVEWDLRFSSSRLGGSAASKWVRCPDGYVFVLRF